MKTILAKLYTFLGYILTTIKYFPEFFALPLVILSLALLQRGLLWMDSTNAIYSDDWIQTVAMGAIILLTGNVLAHGAIKYNQKPIWVKYKTWLSEGGDMPSDYFKLLLLYLVGYAVVMVAVI